MAFMMVGSRETEAGWRKPQRGPRRVTTTFWNLCMGPRYTKRAHCRVGRNCDFSHSLPFSSGHQRARVAGVRFA
jgi:hypothetical protein